MTTVLLYLATTTWNQQPLTALWAPSGVEKLFHGLQVCLIFFVFFWQRSSTSSLKRCLHRAVEFTSRVNQSNRSCGEPCTTYLPKTPTNLLLFSPAVDWLFSILCRVSANNSMRRIRGMKMWLTPDGALHQQMSPKLRSKRMEHKRTNKILRHNGHVTRLNLGAGGCQGSFHKLNALGK